MFMSFVRYCVVWRNGVVCDERSLIFVLDFDVRHCAPIVSRPQMNCPSLMIGHCVPETAQRGTDVMQKGGAVGFEIQHESTCLIVEKI